MKRPEVSVVIPSAGRDSLHLAVASARAQVDVDTHVLVVLNGGDKSPKTLCLPKDVDIIEAPRGTGVNECRQLGLERARSALAALLDDDDVWLPWKLSSQLDAVRNAGLTFDDDWVASCGLNIVDRVVREPILAPRSPKDLSNFGHEKLRSYLFERRSLRDRCRQLQTSTLLFPTRIASHVKFDPDQSFHQDWSWLLAVADSLQPRFVLAPQYLVSYVRQATSLTSGTDPLLSARWGESSMRTQRQLGDFLLTVSFNLALQQDDLVASRTIFEMATTSAKPGPCARVRARARLTRASARA